MVGIIRVPAGVGHHPFGLHFANDINHLVLRVTVQPERIITKIEEADIAHAKRCRRVLRLFLAGFFYPLKRHPVLFPELGALTALAIRKASDGNLIAHLLMQGDGTACPPDKIGSMGADDKGCFCVRHSMKPYYELGFCC